MLRAHTADRRVLIRRLRWTVPAAVLAVAATTVLLFRFPGSWALALLGGACAVLALGAVVLLNRPDPERPRPDAPLEAARVVGTEILTWGGVSTGDTHGLRVIAEIPAADGAPDTLVHGYRQVPSVRDGRPRDGTLIGVRRFPGRGHLVWLDSGADARTLAVRDARARTAAGPLPEHAARIVEHGTRTTARIREVRIGTDRVGARWHTTVRVELPGGAVGTATGHYLPEELLALVSTDSARVAWNDTPKATAATGGVRPPPRPRPGRGGTLTDR
ncbi:MULTISPECIES: hypothetical protein [unclassified Streptomyces]|uniref:hypothetical protein n=1 Tax=unclassified Streptomyces TaxID=2593676 RepID=UPI0035DE3928